MQALFAAPSALHFNPSKADWAAGAARVRAGSGGFGQGQRGVRAGSAGSAGAEGFGRVRAVAARGLVGSGGFGWIRAGSAGAARLGRAEPSRSRRSRRFPNSAAPSVGPARHRPALPARSPGAETAAPPRFTSETSTLRCKISNCRMFSGLVLLLFSFFPPSSPCRFGLSADPHQKASVVSAFLYFIFSLLQRS